MYRSGDRSVRCGDADAEERPGDVTEARGLGVRVGTATGLICLAVAAMTVRPLGILRAMFLVGLCAAGGVATAALMAYCRFPRGLATETPGNTSDSAKQPPVRFWRVKTTILRRRHPDGTTDEVLRQEAEGMD